MPKIPTLLRRLEAVSINIKTYAVLLKFGLRDSLIHFYQDMQKNWGPMLVVKMALIKVPLITRASSVRFFD